MVATWPQNIEQERVDVLTVFTQLFSGFRGVEVLRVVTTYERLHTIEVVIRVPAPTVAWCPACTQPLKRVRRPSESMLNAEQFDSVRAGDWYCEKCPSNGRGVSSLRYFWNKEVGGEDHELVVTASYAGAKDLAELVGRLCTEGIRALENDRRIQ